MVVVVVGSNKKDGGVSCEVGDATTLSSSGAQIRPNFRNPKDCGNEKTTREVSREERFVQGHGPLCETTHTHTHNLRKA